MAFVVPNIRPLMTGAAAVFPYSEALQKQFVFAGRFDDQEPIVLYKSIGSGEHRRLCLPRQLFPIAENDLRVEGAPIETQSSFKPRSLEQSRVVEESVELLEDGESHIIQAPTGFGKTICGTEIIHRIGRKTLIVVDKEDTRDQWFDAIKTVLGLSHSQVGLVQGDTVRYTGCPIVIGMIHSICKPGRYPASFYRTFGLVVADECDRVAADKFSEMCWLFPAKLRLGMSATPSRKDGRDIVLRAHIGEVKVKSTVANTGCKVLVRRTGYRIPRWKDCHTGKIVQMYHTPARAGKVISLMCRDVQRNRMIVQFVTKAYKKGRYVMVFSVSREHLDVLQEMLRREGVPDQVMCQYVGGLKDKTRDFYKKHKQIFLATYQMTSRATDIPRLDTGVLATPRSDVVQIVGRIRRAHPEKADPVLLDLVDDDSKVFLGFANARRRWYRSQRFEVVAY